MRSLEIQKRLDALKPYIITPEADAPDPHYFGGEENQESDLVTKAADMLTVVESI